MLIAEKYVVERVLGEGGIGVVVAAKHVDLEQTVAIKYLRPKALTGTNAAERFLREARLAARIRSDHVVHVYDVGRLPDGSPYMVMEYLAGTDLGRLLTVNGPLPLDRAIDYVLQTCEALAVAHVAGVVHRDLKPDNLFVSTGAAGKSIVKIVDFGISKMSAKRTTERLQELTQADDKFGTPVYMSPEQLRASRDVDARADIWAVGVVLYELLTGCLPFDGDGLPELCTAILTMPPVSLRQRRPELPAGLQAVIERCLEKEAERRFQNVAELAQELRPFASPAAASRIDHVVSVLSEAGEAIRPPTPVPGDSTSRLLSQAATLGAAEAREVLTTNSTAASSREVLPDGTISGWPRRRAAILAGAVLTVLAVVAFVGLGRRPAETAAPATSGTPAAVVLAPPPTATPVEAPAVDPALDPAAAPATAPAVRGVPVGPRHGHPKTSPSASASGAPKKTPAPASTAFDQSGVINPFE
jgi:serine/threonine-protein kinase